MKTTLSKDAEEVAVQNNGLCADSSDGNATWFFVFVFVFTGEAAWVECTFWKAVLYVFSRHCYYGLHQPLFGLKTLSVLQG